MSTERSFERSRSGRQFAFVTSVLVIGAIGYASVTWLRAKSETPEQEQPQAAAKVFTPKPVPAIVEETQNPSITEAILTVQTPDEEATVREAEKPSESPSVSELYDSGLQHLRAGDPTAAVEDFEAILSEKPHHFNALVNLARAEIQLEEYEEALSNVDKAISLDTTDAAAWRVRGRVLQSWGETSDAISAYEKSIQLREDNPYAYNNLGLIYIQQGQFVEALPLLEHAVEQKTDVAFFFNNLGLTYEATGDLTSAEDAFEKALQLDPDYEKASISLVRVRLNQPGGTVSQESQTNISDHNENSVDERVLADQDSSAKNIAQAEK